MINPIPELTPLLKQLPLQLVAKGRFNLDAGSQEICLL